MYFKYLLAFLFITKYVKLINCNNNNNDACRINLSVQDKHVFGGYRLSENGIPYCAYLGIPYAKPPINELRFKPPESTDFVNELVNRYVTPGNQCFSEIRSTGIQSEDCLYLNIFIPINILRANKTNAVVVWIHGGSYNVGSGLSDMHPTRGPELYVENDMIFVSFNYRLGVLGFLRVPELNITGNYGLLDQRFALKWVHENIYLWNGDKNNVTLMGWRAGSASVSYHLLANESNQYFNRVILMSGSLLNPWAQFDYPEYCLKQLLYGLNIDPQNVSRLLTINPTEFQADNSGVLSFVHVNVCFVPTVDQIIIGDTIDYKLHKHIDVMIGWTSLELHNFYFEMLQEIRDAYFNPFKYLILLNHTEGEVRQLWGYLKNEFINNTAAYLDINTANFATNDSKAIYWLLSKIMSDDFFKYGIRNLFKNLQKANDPQSVNIFVYEFSYDGKFYMHRKFNNGLNGAVHGDDLALMYRTEQNLRGNNTNYDEEYKNELFVQKSLITMWTNFMKHGNPTPTAISSSPNDIEESLIWEEYKMERRLLDINLQMRMVLDTDDVFYQLCFQFQNCIEHKVCSFLDR